MSTWGTRGLRGSTLEELVNRTNDQYRQQKLALIQKIPTPITPVKFDKEERHITLAYFEQKSTVDYIGSVQGIPVCFDAKECGSSSFALSNIHPHQFRFMQDFQEQEGIAFILIYFTDEDRFYYLRFCELEKFLKRAEDGGPKRFSKEELDRSYYLPKKQGIFVPYLDMIQKDLSERE